MARVAAGFLALCGVTADESWLARATDLLDTALGLFRADDGGFHDTPSDGERLVTRPRDPSDNASPSGTSAMIHALLAAHALTGDGRWSDAAEEALAGVADLARRAPRFAGWSLAAAQAVLAGAPEIAVVGPRGPDRDHLERRARAWPGATVVVADAAMPGIPLLEGRGPVDGRPAAYVCRSMVCAAPVTSPDDLVSGGCSVPLVLPRPRPGGAANQNEVRMGDPTEGETSTPLVDDLTRIAESVRSIAGADGALVSRVLDDEWLEVIAVAGTLPAADPDELPGLRWRRDDLARSLEHAERLGHLHVTGGGALPYVAAPRATTRQEFPARPSAATSCSHPCAPPPASSSAS